jgi:hypothetical protein
MEIERAWLGAKDYNVLMKAKGGAQVHVCINITH